MVVCYWSISQSQTTTQLAGNKHNYIKSQQQICNIVASSIPYTLHNVTYYLLIKQSLVEFLISSITYFLMKEDEYREMVSISHTMEDEYGQYFDSVIPFEVNNPDIGYP